MRQSRTHCQQLERHCCENQHPCQLFTTLTVVRTMVAHINRNRQCKRSRCIVIRRDMRSNRQQRSQCVDILCRRQSPQTQLHKHVVNQHTNNATQRPITSTNVASRAASWLNCCVAGVAHGALAAVAAAHSRSCTSAKCHSACATSSSARN